MVDRQRLRDEGWEEPLKQSLVEVPDGWYGGKVVHTGGGIYNRVWIDQPERPTNEHSSVEEYLEIAYDSKFVGAQLVRYKRDENGKYDFDGNIEANTVNEQTDSSCAKAARKLMREF